MVLVLLHNSLTLIMSQFIASTMVSPFLDTKGPTLTDIASSYGSSFNPGDGEDDDEDDYQPIVHSNALHEKIAPSLMLQNTILAVTHADSNDTPENIRDASVMWYVYIADVDDGKKRLKIVSPISGRVPLNALLWGGWPEGVPDLVA